MTIKPVKQHYVAFIVEAEDGTVKSLKSPATEQEYLEMVTFWEGRQNRRAICDPRRDGGESL